MEREKLAQCAPGSKSGSGVDWRNQYHSSLKLSELQIVPFSRIRQGRCSLTYSHNQCSLDSGRGGMVQEKEQDRQPTERDSQEAKA